MSALSSRALLFVYSVHFWVFLLTLPNVASSRVTGPKSMLELPADQRLQRERVNKRRVGIGEPSLHARTARRRGEIRRLTSRGALLLEFVAPVVAVVDLQPGALAGQVPLVESLRHDAF